MKKIIVTGDVTADWNIAGLARGTAEGINCIRTDFSRACLQEGGAAMLGRLLKEMAKISGKAMEVESISLPKRLVRTDDNRAYHSYVMWKAHPFSDKDKQQVWRVHSFLGLDPYCGGDDANECKLEGNQFAGYNPDIVVIDDAGLLFRHNQDLWPEDIKTGKPHWVVIKMSNPIAQHQPGSLWNHILEHHADRTIVLMSITDFRTGQVRISKAQSWEQSAEDLDWEFTYGSGQSGLSECAMAIVSFGAVGAYHHVNHAGNKSAHLIYDPKFLEGEWGRNIQGKMMGLNTCLCAALVREIACSDNIAQPDVHTGLRKGIALMRQLHQIGYGEVFRRGTDFVSSPAFPYRKLAEYSMPENLVFGCRKTPAYAQVHERNGDWLILEDICRQKEKEIAKLTPGGTFYGDMPNQVLYDIATDMAIRGHEEATPEIPILRYGKLITADRREIEAFRRVAASIESYVSAPLARPLCLAVFGAPGSGKSFGVKQVAKSMNSCKIVSITFNISQWADNRDLVNALHQVRDISLTGDMPLVFWDEFDTSRCDFLKNFLAPMQDGEFQDGQITYHTGKAIFVFAGGTSDTYQNFGTKLDRDKLDGEFSQKKGPDFLSRLHNYLNIAGPNPDDKNQDSDKMYIIRRALLLRNMLEDQAPHLFENKVLRIDPGVLQAFLSVSKYYHGARSLNSIICTSDLVHRNSFDQSALPSTMQLDMHVNAIEFHGKMTIFKQGE